MDNLTFVSLDTETTGLSLENDRIIQYGFSVFIRGVCVHTATFDVRQSIPNMAFDINRIGPDRIANGLDPMDAAVLVCSMLSKKPKRFLVYNAPFDLGFIAKEFNRFGLAWDFRTLTIIDPLVIWRRFHPFKKGTLSYAAAYYGIPYDESHDAGADSSAAGHVYCQMYGQHGQLRNTYSNKMLSGWYDHWAGSFVQYLKSKNLPVDIESFQWPVRGELLCSDSSVTSELSPLW